MDFRCGECNPKPCGRATIFDGHLRKLLSHEGLEEKSLEMTSIISRQITDYKQLANLLSVRH